MIDVYSLADQFIQNVNPDISATWKSSTGYNTANDGTRTPTFTSSTVVGNLQAVTGEDLKHLDGLNIEGVSRVFYVNQDVQGVVRKFSKGGDLLVIATGPEPGTYLVVAVLETWPDWSKVALRMQLDS
jgi:hypothetical protein